MENRINEEIRQFKLYKIQLTENKVQEYKRVYDSIKENIIIKIAKNSSSFIFRFGITISIILMLIVAVIFFFPYQLLDYLESGGVLFTNIERTNFVANLPFIELILLGLCFLLLVVARLLKVNNRKRNIIYHMSKLLDDIILYMENTSKEEKQKYVAFIDNVSEQKIMEEKKERESREEKTPHDKS